MCLLMISGIKKMNNISGIEVLILLASDPSKTLNINKVETITISIYFIYFNLNEYIKVNET